MENQSKNQSPVLCRSGCGFYGTSATEGLCSKCFKDTNTSSSAPRRSPSPKTVPSSTAIVVETIETVLSPDTVSSSIASVGLKTASELATAGSSSSSDATLSTVDTGAGSETSASSSSAASQPKAINRCATCKKRVRLIGFTCRCGGLYCAEHRYDDAHDCQFDYKTAEREEIRKKNPLVVSDKIQRI